MGVTATLMDEFDQLLADSSNGNASAKYKLIRYITTHNLAHHGLVEKYGNDLIQQYSRWFNISVNEFRASGLLSFFYFIRACIMIYAIIPLYTLITTLSLDSYTIIYYHIDDICEITCLATLHTHNYALRNQLLEVLEARHQFKIPQRITYDDGDIQTSYILTYSQRTQLIRGKIFESAELWDSATEIYKLIINEPATERIGAQARKRLICISLSLGKHQEAIEQLRHLSTLDINDYTIWYQLYTLYTHQGMYCDAVHVAERLVLIQPHNAQSYILLGTSLLQLARIIIRLTSLRRVSSSSSSSSSSSFPTITFPTPQKTAQGNLGDIDISIIKSAIAELSCDTAAPSTSSISSSSSQFPSPSYDSHFCLTMILIYTARRYFVVAYDLHSNAIAAQSICNTLTLATKAQTHFTKISLLCSQILSTDCDRNSISSQYIKTQNERSSKFHKIALDYLSRYASEKKTEWDELNSQLVEATSKQGNDATLTLRHAISPADLHSYYSQ